MTRAAVFVAVLVTLALTAGAGERGDAALDQALLDLSSDLRVAWVGARPGDEDWATLAWLRRSLGVETRLLLLTRGEGGQSESGSELGAELGELRERETRAAAALVGCEVEFLGLSDSGFTASRDQALLDWGGKEAVRRVVRALRRARPHVVLYGAPHGDGRRGAVAALMEQAFGAVDDSEQLPKAGSPWIVSAVFASGGEKVSGVRAPIEIVDPVRGLSFAQMGRVARRAQASLGADSRSAGPGETMRSFRLVHSTSEDPWESLLARLPVPRPEWRTGAHRAGTREEILTRVLALTERPEEDRPPAAKIDRAAALAHGLELLLRPPERAIVFGEEAAVRVFLRNGGSRPVTWGDAKATLGPQSVIELPAVTVSPKAPGTTVSKSVSVFLGPRAVPVEVYASTRIEAHPALEVRVAPWGRLFRPAAFLDDVEQEISRFCVEIVNRTSEAREEDLTFTVEGTDRLEVVEPGLVKVAAGGRRWIRIVLHARRGLKDGLYPVQVAWGPAVVRDSLRVLDVRIVGELNVGVVETIGDDVVQFLRSVGIQPTRLSDQDLVERDLKNFDTIWLGIRAYHERPVLALVNDRLLKYVRGGGHLVVSYHRPEEWSPSHAPWPLEIGRDRVDEEDARVTFEEPQHRLFTIPNRVEARDFEGWSTERALWLPSSWDRQHFRVLLTSADRGATEGPCLLLAKAGNGTYVYTSFTWFRQLRNLHPGAMKMVANLISYPWR